MDYRLRLKKTLSPAWGRQGPRLGALALSGGHYFENIILTGKRITTNLGIIRDPGHTEPWIIAMSAKPGYLTTWDTPRAGASSPCFRDFIESRGFGLQQTHLRYPDRLARLILVMALALYWAVSTGMWTTQQSSSCRKKHPDHQPAKLARGRLSWFTRGLRRAIKLLLNASRSQSSGDV